MEKKASGKDKLHINNRGYSLIELIIVIAIIAVLLTTVIFSITMVFSANAKACANDIQRAISDCKVTTMGQAGKSQTSTSEAETYLEIYRGSNDKIYGQMYVNGAEEGEAEELGPSRVSVSYTPSGSGSDGSGDGGEVELGAKESGQTLKIAFDRASGSFTKDTCKSIEVQGGTKHYEITLIQLTGKTSVELK